MHPLRPGLQERIGALAHRRTGGKDVIYQQNPPNEVFLVEYAPTTSFRPPAAESST
jgi:hypothetical protein